MGSAISRNRQASSRPHHPTRPGVEVEPCCRFRRAAIPRPVGGYPGYIVDCTLVGKTVRRMVRLVGVW
jgi:hypothetical protein